MIEWEGEKYCNAKEAAALLKVSRPTFYNNVKDLLCTHELPARRLRHYKVSEVEVHRKIKRIAAVQLDLSVELTEKAS
jgi:hypothetical protein